MSKKIILDAAQFSLNYRITNKSRKIKFGEVLKILNY